MSTQLASLLQAALGPDYAIERELDGGGMSRLFLTLDRRHNRQVVVKVLASELVSPESIARFKREIAWTIKLQHPNILPILTSGEFGDCLYYITPFISGESLRTRLKRDGKLPLDDIVRILRDVSDALAFAHAEGVVHRDVKPGNILLTSTHAILADFGIARAIETQSTPLTASGMVPGTPAYMSPDLPTDASADVFALGVVGYEMLCGELPTGEVTVPRIVAQRRSIPGESRRSLLAVADLVARTVDPTRTPRVTSASAFLSAIENARARSVPNRRSAAIAAGLLAVALAAGGWAYIAHPSRAALSPMKYVLAPIDPRDEPARWASHQIEHYLGEWRGLSLLDSSASGRRGDRNDVEGLLRAAAAVGARNMVRISARPHGDSVDVQAALYDVAADSVVRDGKVLVSASAADPGTIMSMRRLVNHLVRDDDDLPWRTAADQSRPSLVAWQSYDRGRADLRAWKLIRAVSAFQTAVAQDPAHALAHLWLAQTLMWADTLRVDEARMAVTRALNGGGTLSVRDSLLAVGVAAMIDARYDAARASFKSLVHDDSTFFPGWLNLGEVETRDPVVARSSATTTGWVFRGSYENAARAYREAALTTDASATSEFRGWILGRLARVLVFATNTVRTGFHVEKDTVFMGAFPYLDADSEAFAPHPAADFATRKGDPLPQLVQRAAERSRRILRSSAEDWVRASPRDPAAFDSLAKWSEVTGGKASVGGQQMSTLELLHTARALSSDSMQQLRLAIAETRVLVKEGQFARAQHEADSLLRHGARAQYRNVSGIVGLTTLVGRVHETASLIPLAQREHRIQLRDGSAWTPPRAVEETAASLLTYSIFGQFPDSVRVLARRTCELIDDYVPNRAQAARVRSAVIGWTLGFGDPREALIPNCEIDAADELVKAVLMGAHGDTAGARRQLLRLKEIDAGKDPGNGLPFAVRSARLWLALGDTAAAERELDDVVRTVPLLDVETLDDVVRIGSLVPAFVMRAEIAQRRGDIDKAAASAGVVAMLWRDADPQLQPLVRTMTAMMSRRP